uniref:IS701 family transposase n=1 Tax=Streptomyces chiangmaiensis TaxID=766497 RepID=UPI0038B6381B
MIDEHADATWERELNDLFLSISHRFGRADLRRRMRDYVRGLLAPVGRKNGWQLAEFAGHRTPDGLQRLLNGAIWDADDVRDDLQSYVAKHLGDDDGVLVIDDTGFIKKGATSAGVQRQYSGTAGRTENCQIGVFAAYATARGRALVDRELYLPKSWTDCRQRCRAAKIPDLRAFATKGELAKRLVLRALASDLPLAWVTADAAYGQEGRFRRLLEQSGLGYVLAVPKSQQVFGPRIDHLFAQAPDEAWEPISCGDGA